MPWYGFTQYGVIDIPELEATSTLGQIFMYPSSVARDDTDTAYVTGPPIGYLRCDGSDVLITEYQDLYDYFVASGVSFGVAPVGFFKLPNLSSRWPIGLNVGDADVNVIGETGGAASHSHTVPDGGHTHSTPYHTHTVANHTHSYGDHTHTLPSHTHSAGTLSVPNNGQTNTFYGGNAYQLAGPTHSHNIGGSTAASGGVSGTPVTNDSGTPKNNTGTIDGGVLPIAVTLNDSQGGPTAATSLTAASGVESIPPYYSMYFIIKV